MSKTDERKKQLKSSGYILDSICGICEKKYEANDIRFTFDKKSNIQKYYIVPFECPECRNRWAKDDRHRRRREIISFFAEDKYDPKCAICGENNYDKLELDHIDGNGKKERLERKINPRRKYWEWDHKDEYQVLCKTCNRRKSDLTLETITPIYKNLLKHHKKKKSKSSH